MGSILFIRVSAVTYSEEDVARRWPRLWDCTWGDGRKNSVQPLTGISAKGVLELGDTLSDLIEYDGLAADLTTKLQSGIVEYRTQKQRLETALGDRDVQTAHLCTNAIEDALDAMEKQMQ